MVSKPTTDEILKKYGKKIESEMQDFDSKPQNFSGAYQGFRDEISPKYSFYEKLCKNLGNLVKLNPAKKDGEKISRYLEIAHLNITAGEAVGFAIVSFLLIFIFGALAIISFWMIFSNGAIENFPAFLFLLLVFLAFAVYYVLYSYPQRLATQWRLKAASQMIPAILYIVIYMKHTSNFEKAVAFASQHLDEPLSSDFKKIFWDVEVGRFSNLKESVDNYLERWSDYSREFIESFHLIESSLYEPTEAMRVSFLEKALQVILDGVYDKMLKYVHGVKAPLTNIYMLGIILPTLSLAILPLATTMLGGSIKAYHLFVLFNIIVPLLVLLLVNKIILERPGGYGDSSQLEKNPLYPKYSSKKPYLYATLICLPILILGFLPLIWTYTPLSESLGLAKDPTWGDIGLGFVGGEKEGIFGIIQQDGKTYGPIGLLSLILSLFIPLSIALIFIIANSVRTKEMIVERERYKKIEDEFNASLFQLGNRLGDGVPPEIAFSKVAYSSKGLTTEGFFSLVNQNIQQLGMSVENAIFNRKRGAIIFYPSHLIEISMRILVESSKKGLQIAAKSLMSISEYVKNLKKIDDRMADLLAEIIADMKSNMVFLAPLLSGIIVGLSSMIILILGGLSRIVGATGSSELGALGSSFGLTSLLSSAFDVTKMIPPFWIQLSVGIYLIETIFILTSTLVIINSGKDELFTTYEIGQHLKRGIFLYFVVALLAILGLAMLGAIVLAGF